MITVIVSFLISCLNISLDRDLKFHSLISFLFFFFLHNVDHKVKSESPSTSVESVCNKKAAQEITPPSSKDATSEVMLCTIKYHQ